MFDRSKGSQASPKAQANYHNTASQTVTATSPFPPRPTFSQWLRTYGPDILLMACMGAVGLGIYMAPPAPTRSFPIQFSDGEIVYPQFSYPLRKEIIPIWLSALLSSLIPILIFGLAQFRVRSFWDFNVATFGVLQSLITAAVFQVFLKWLIGGLRPHFLAVCQPDLSGVYIGDGFKEIMFNKTICTGDEKTINDSLESFPSGHSTAAFAGFVFLSLYMNAKLKIFSNYRPAYWKVVMFFAPLLGATLIAGALTIDEFHNWYDCLAGAIIGTMTAYACFRMSFAAVWDYRYNHIPLSREGLPIGDMGLYVGGTFTHDGGWGVMNRGGGHEMGTREERFSGATAGVDSRSSNV